MSETAKASGKYQQNDPLALSNQLAAMKVRYSPIANAQLRATTAIIINRSHIRPLSYRDAASSDIQNNGIQGGMTRAPNRKYVFSAAAPRKPTPAALGFVSPSLTPMAIAPAIIANNGGKNRPQMKAIKNISNAPMATDCS